MHFENLLFILLIAMAALLRLLATKAGNAKKGPQKVDQGPTITPKIGESIRRARVESDRTHSQISRSARAADDGETASADCAAHRYSAATCGTGATSARSECSQRFHPQKEANCRANQISSARANLRASRNPTRTRTAGF